MYKSISNKFNNTIISYVVYLIPLIISIMFFCPLSVYASDYTDEYDPGHDYTTDIFNMVANLYGSQGLIASASVYRDFMDDCLNPNVHNLTPDYWGYDWVTQAQASDAFVNYHNYIGTTKEDYYKAQYISYAINLLNSTEAFRSDFCNYCLSLSNYLQVPTLSSTYLMRNSGYLFTNNQERDAVFSYCSWNDVNIIMCGYGTKYVFPVVDLQDDCCFVLKSNNFNFNSQTVNNLYQSMNLILATTLTRPQCFIYDNYGTELFLDGHSVRYGGSSNSISSVNYKSNKYWFGYQNNGQWGWFFSDSVSYVLFFKDAVAYTDFMAGNQQIIQSEYLKQLVGKEFDFDTLYKTIQDNIRHGTWTTPRQLQDIIDNSITDYLESIGEDVEDIAKWNERIYGAMVNDEDVSYLKLTYEGQLLLVDFLRQNNKTLEEVKQLLVDNDALLLQIYNYLLNNPSGSCGGSSEKFFDIRDLVEILILNDDIDIINCLLSSGVSQSSIASYQAGNSQGTDVFDSTKAYASTKFPFSVFVDLQLLIDLLYVEPAEPVHINQNGHDVVTFPLEFSFVMSSINDDSVLFIDLSWFDAWRSSGYYEAFWTLGFIFLLFFASYKFVGVVKE